MKYGKKQFTVDEHRRDTYRQQFHSQSSANNSSVHTNSMGDMRQLMMVCVMHNSLFKFMSTLPSLGFSTSKDLLM